MNRRPWLLLLPALTACGDKGEDTEPVELTPWEDADLIGVANWDDDDGNGDSDWDDKIEDDNDQVALVFDASEAGDNEGTTLTLELDGDVDNIRVWFDGDRVLDDDEQEFELDDFEEDGAEFGVEFADTLVEGTLVVTLTDSEGDVLNEQTLTLLSAPLILNHHLQPATEVMSMEVSGGGGNRAFVQGFEDELGDMYSAYAANSYGWDVWLQDEIEFGTMVAPGHTMDFVIDSIRTNNGNALDKLPEEHFYGEDFGLGTWGEGRATSQDSFGNLEVSPPVTVDGVEYPFGRIYYGTWNRNGGLVSEMADKLEEQKVQDPFKLDVTFLCVGHVDEFQTFVPDPTAPKGFRWIVNDSDLAREFLEAMDPDTEIPQYRNDHGFSTVGEILDEEELWLMNDEIMVDYIEPAIEDMKTELGLDEEDIIRIPGMVEEVRGCGGTTVALIPGTANMTVVPDEDGNTKVFMPDPFLRASTNASAADPFKDEIESLIPASLEPIWLDDWDNYHIMLGEVHCGSNVIRTPIDNWWESARHLLGGD